MYFDEVTKKLVLEKGKVVPLTNDLVFKNVVKNVVNRDFLAKIINLVTNIDYDYLLQNMIVIDADIPDTSIYLHHNEQDVVVTIDDKLINIEMSVDKYKNKRKNEITGHKFAASMYKKGSDYNEKFIFYQIAIEKYNIFNNNELITEVGLTDLKSGELETDEFKKYHVNLNNIPNKCYNELNERERYFKLFSIDDIKELEKISVGDNIMKKVTDTMQSLSSNPFFMTELERKQLDDYCTAVGQKEREADLKKEVTEQVTQQVTQQVTKKVKEETEKAKQIEIAKKSLEENLDIKVIARITGLTIEEINNLK